MPGGGTGSLPCGLWEDTKAFSVGKGQGHFCVTSCVDSENDFEEAKMYQFPCL